jgi:hypothetical protein
MCLYSLVATLQLHAVDKKALGPCLKWYLSGSVQQPTNYIITMIQHIEIKSFADDSPMPTLIPNVVAVSV